MNRVTKAKRTSVHSQSVHAEGGTRQKAGLVVLVNWILLESRAGAPHEALSDDEASFELDQREPDTSNAFCGEGGLKRCSSLRYDAVVVSRSCSAGVGVRRILFPPKRGRWRSDMDADRGAIEPRMSRIFLPEDV